MSHETRTNLHVVIRHHDTRLSHLMSRDQTMRIRTSLIYDADVDIKLLILEEVAGERVHPSWPIRVDLRRLTRNPRVVQQRTEIEIVIRMMMRDEDVAHSIKGHAGR